MKKRILSLILAIAMLATSACTVFAVTDVDFEGDLTGAIDFIADKTPATTERRAEILSYIFTYIASGDDRDMETLINSISSGSFAGSGAAIDDLNGILGALNDPSNADVKAAALLLLEMIYAIPADVREDVIDGFGVKPRVAYEIGDTDETAFDEALVSLYNNDNVYPAVLRDAMEEHEDMTEAPYIIVNLFTAWTGCFKFTDDADGNGFALKSVDTNYAEKLAPRLANYTLGGAAIDSVEEVLEAVVGAINSTYSDEEIAAMKIVMDDSNLDLYVKKSTTDEDEDSSSTNRPGSRPGSSSSKNDKDKDDKPIIDEPVGADKVFPDTENHWAKSYISALAVKGIIKGYEDGTFRPDIGITREEMAVVLVRLLDIENELGTVAAAEYTDAADIAAWAKASVDLLSAKGIYTGYDDGEFKPKRIISREEIVALVMRQLGDKSASTTLKYFDSENIGEWARKYVAQASALGIISGRDDGKYYPKDDVTRAETCKILYNFLYHAE